MVRFSSCWDSEAWFLLPCGSSSILKILPFDAWNFLKWQKPFLVCFQRMIILTNKMTKGQPSYRGTKAIQAKINLIKRYDSELLECFCVFYCCIYKNLQGEQGRPAVSFRFHNCCFFGQKCPVTFDWGSCELFLEFCLQTASVLYSQVAWNASGGLQWSKVGRTHWYYRVNFFFLFYRYRG